MIYRDRDIYVNLDEVVAIQDSEGSRGGIVVLKNGMTLKLTSYQIDAILMALERAEKHAMGVGLGLQLMPEAIQANKS